MNGSYELIGSEEPLSYPQCTLFTCSLPGEVGMFTVVTYPSFIWHLGRMLKDFGNIDNVSMMHVSSKNILIVYVAEWA